MVDVKLPHEHYSHFIYHSYALTITESHSIFKKQPPPEEDKERYCHWI